MDAIVGRGRISYLSYNFLARMNEWKEMVLSWKMIKANSWNAEKFIGVEDRNSKM